MLMQRMDSDPFSAFVFTLLLTEGGVDIDIDASADVKCEQSIKPCSHLTSAFASKLKNGFYGNK